MKHDINTSGFVYRLRPVMVDDAQTIIDIRLADAVRNRYIHPISPDPVEQIKWLARYYEREDDYYFAAENIYTNEVDGLVGIYNIEGNNGEWGRLVSRKNSFVIPDLIGLTLKVAFVILNLKKLVSFVNTNNKHAVTTTEGTGAVCEGRRIADYEIDDVLQEEICYYLTPEIYETVSKPYLEKAAQSVYNMYKRRQVKLKENGRC